MLKLLTVFCVSMALTVFSGCAGHKDLRAPCATPESAMTSLFSSSAFASSVSCGPLVRQSGVSMF
ncbi:hypothetical protein [Rhizobium sp. C4]|uniref:hypothetical protein n=1 Tax=Rhizobium sp. C4 TaxID=1349800 RepID=UPI001E304A58|nr:hypothetical protein [Rhizobium sp. C4]MCD2174946.1 hypothetical protein [Rhizobium sp. C4]